MFAFPLWNHELKELLHINQARGPYWENIARGRSFWYGLSEVRSVQERLRAISSHYGSELVRYNKKSIIWLFLTLNHLTSEPWRIGMNETVYRKAFKTQQFHTKKSISHKKK